jgi:hypothetical protein
MQSGFSQSFTCCLFERFKVDLLSLQQQEDENCKGNLHLFSLEIHIFDPGYSAQCQQKYLDSQKLFDLP